MARRPKRSHNGGPPLDDYEGPPWGKGDACIFLAWRAAHDKAWKAPSQAIMLMRLERAERRLGLTYEGIHARDPGARTAPQRGRRRAHRGNPPRASPKTDQ